jgi:uncharacterized protein (TIGR03435 family)
MTFAQVFRLSLLLPLAALCALTQSAVDEAATFEVASVKPSVTDAAGRGAKGGPGYNSSDPTLFPVRSRSLKSLIVMAHGVEDFRVTGGPAWIATDRFDVDAKTAAPATREQMMAMLRNLLADRFQLKVHHQSRQVPSYVLQLAKGGPKFGPQFHKLVDGAQPTDGRNADMNKGIPMGGSIKNFIFLLGMNMRNTNPEGVAQDVPPITDQTGLEGEYEIFLRVSGPTDDLPAAVEQQLGLKMELKKQITDLLVIDSAAKPSGN